jgi:hypothetical protein
MPLHSIALGLNIYGKEKHLKRWHIFKNRFG